MKRLRVFPNTPTSASTLGYATIDLTIVLIARQIMPEILFVAFIAFIIFLVLVDKD
jgi:hypothetical protein